MANSTFMQTNFVSGELSPLLKGRTDLDQYYAGCETAENVLIVPQGGLKRRAGTEHIDQALRQLNGLLYSSTLSGTMDKGGTTSTGGNLAAAIAALNDFSSSTIVLTTTDIDSVGVGATEYEIAKYTYTASNPIVFVDVQNIQLTAGTESNVLPAAVQVQISSNGTNWSPLQTITVTSASQDVRVKVVGTYTSSFIRLVRTGDTGDLGDKRFQLTDLNVIVESKIGNVFQVSKTKTFSFSIETDRHYLAVATGGLNSVTVAFGNMAFYRIPHAGSANTVLVGNVRLPYRSDQIDDIRDAQTENVMLLFQEDHSPKRIINKTGDTFDAFTIDNIPFTNIPKYDYDDSLSPVPENDVQTLTFTAGSGSWIVGDTYQIDVEGVVSKNITYAGDLGTNAQNQQTATRFRLEKNLQEMPVYGETGVDVERIGTNQHKITVSGESTKAFELYAGFPTSGTANKSIVFSAHTTGSPRKEPVWSATRGYPRMGVFHEGRLWLGGTKSKQQSLFASKSGSFFDFFFEEGDDDEGMFITITSKNLTTIVGINSDRGLQVFTAGAEFLVKGSTPTTVAIESQTQHGSSNLEAKSIDGATLFVDQNGKSIRQFVYNFNEDAYTSNDISVLSSHLIKQPIDLAVLTGTTSEDSSWVFIINTDGTASILNTVRAQDINGFTQFISADSGQLSNGAAIPKDVFSASVVNNDLFLVNRYRATTGTPYTYSIEKWDFDRLLDASIILGNVSATTVSLGTSHFNNATVSVIGSGNNLDKRTVSNTGTITLTSNELSGGPLNLEVGLNFVPTVKPMPLNTNMGKGQNAMKQKKITNMNFRFYESAGIYIDGNPSPIRQMTTFYNTFAFLINSGTPVVGNSYSVNGATYFANSFVGSILTATRTSGRGALPASGNLIGTPNLTYLSVDATNSPLGEPFEIRTGIIEDNNGGNGWGIDVAPLITVPDAAPFHIQAIQYEVESS